VRPTATDKRSFRSRLRAERGSMLIEVMVGAVILAIATTAVLDGLDGAQGTGARNKARSVAAALAEQDQERLRALPPTQLPGLADTRTVTVRGVDYTVKSTATWVVDSGGVVSCTNNARTTASVKIVSEVTSRATRGVVDEASLVTPPPGTHGPGEGTIVVQIVDRDQEPWQGVTVRLTGTASHTATTNEFGCAAFPFIPVGPYTAEVGALGLVGWGGESPVTKGTSATEGKTTLVKLELDAPTAFRVRFDTRIGNTTVAAKGQWATVGNAKLPAPFERTFQASPAGAPNTFVDAAGLYPFLDGYNVYAGPGQDRGAAYCPTNNPSRAPNTGALAPITVIPGGTTSTQSVTARVPSINIHVVRANGSTAGTNARVFIKSADGCSTTYPFQTSANTTAGGSAALPEPGFPYGSYRLCAQTSATAGPHGHADVRLSSGYDSRSGALANETSSNRVDDVVENFSPNGNPTNANSTGAIRIRLNRNNVCE
jgi:type II secretory pathway pseudopilin PulG